TKVVMDHMKPQFYGKATPEQVSELARGLGVAPEAILATGWPVQVVSTGIRQLFVPVRSLKEVQAMSVGKQDTGIMLRVCEALDPADHANGSIMVFCTETVSAAANVHTRMFVPGVGIPEDPATGSASGGLGAYLIEHGIFAATLPTTLIIAEQGLEMGRPSRVEIEVDGTPGAIQMVRVGGQAVKMIEGVLSW
ncbi:MAG TPA: PhzF family phenazine biosynthesis isomerase, partial [Aggregatilineales bacterium]|nr:PhzF family phenazine biosynthesis isomerase [Aggregatilineales bacterium]